MAIILLHIYGWFEKLYTDFVCVIRLVVGNRPGQTRDREKSFARPTLFSKRGDFLKYLTFIWRVWKTIKPCATKTMMRETYLCYEKCFTVESLFLYITFLPLIYLVFLVFLYYETFCLLILVGICILKKDSSSLEISIWLIYLLCYVRFRFDIVKRIEYLILSFWHIGMKHMTRWFRKYIRIPSVRLIEQYPIQQALFLPKVVFHMLGLRLVQVLEPQIQ